MLRQVEKYEIVGEIGRGGMATVYRARDTRLDRLVALKLMHPHLQGAKEARQRFAREALTIARLKHPSILEIYDYSGEDSETSFIATELLTGPTLKQFAEQHREIPAEIGACIAIQIVRALAAAHAEGIVHRDAKPENVLLHEDRCVKLTDFGIAQLVDVQGMTTTGQVLGSPAHMAPEQIEGRGVDPRSDLFALGTILYLLATGDLPFTGTNPHQVLKRIMEARYKDPLVARPSIGGKLAAIIRTLLAVDPDERYQTGAELERDLTRFVGEVGIASPDATLAAYLQAPDAFAQSFRATSIERLIELGERAQRDGDVPEACDYYNRVLALDESNARVLAALQRLARRSRLRRVVLSAGAAVAVAATALGMYVVAPTVAWPRMVPSTPNGPSASVARGAQADARSATTAEAFTGRPARSARASDSSGHAEHKPAPQGSSEASVKGSRATAVGSLPSESPVAPAGALAVEAAPAQGASEASAPAIEAPKGLRRLVFNPYPANVAISVDGQPARAYGPSFRDIDLEPGTHRFRFVGAHDCCIDADVTIRLPAGSSPFPLAPRLKFRPAGLYVVSDTPANVSVDEGKISGRTRSVIQVPYLGDLVEVHRIRVSAEGHRDHTQEVRLQAGQVITVEVNMPTSDS